MSIFFSEPLDQAGRTELAIRALFFVIFFLFLIPLGDGADAASSFPKRISQPYFPNLIQLSSEGNESVPDLLKNEDVMYPGGNRRISYPRKVGIRATRRLRRFSPLEPSSAPQQVQPLGQRVAQKAPQEKSDDQLSGSMGFWEKLMEKISLGAKPVSDGIAPIKEWFEERGQLLRFNVAGQFTRSRFQGNNSPLEGGDISGVFAPALRLTEDSALAFVYNGSYNRELQIFTEDEGPRQQQESQNHNFVLLLSQDYLNPFGSTYIDNVTISPSVYQTYSFTRQTQSEDWGNGLPWRGPSKFKGLYDYWDRGGGSEITVVHKGANRTRDTYSTAFQIYRRHYRNFISLARTQDPSSSEPKFEKDYIGYLGRVAVNHIDPSALGARFSVTHLQKMYTEDRADEDPLVNTGVAGRRRRDNTTTLDARLSHPLPLLEGIAVVALGGTIVANTSTSGFNDTLSPLDSTGVFTSKYYDYLSYNISPELTYSRKIDLPFIFWNLNGVMTLRASYSYERRGYRDRKAKDKDGNLKNVREVDVTHTINPRIEYLINKSWALVFQAKRIIARSNYEDERTSRYNYDLNSFSFGFQYSY